LSVSIARENRGEPTDAPLARISTIATVLLAVLCGLNSSAQTAPLGRKKLLAIGEEKGYRHESVSHALATLERLGRESGLWDTTIRTDTEALTKRSSNITRPILITSTPFCFTPEVALK
jgi:hypothetical protein